MAAVRAELASAAEVIEMTISDAIPASPAARVRRAARPAFHVLATALFLLLAMCFQFIALLLAGETLNERPAVATVVDVGPPDVPEDELVVDYSFRWRDQLCTGAAPIADVPVTDTGATFRVFTDGGCWSTVQTPDANLSAAAGLVLMSWLLGFVPLAAAWEGAREAPRLP